MCFLSSRRIIQVVACAVLLFLCLVNANIQQSRNRVKRKVVFTSSSRFFFRLNGKLTLLNHTDIFAMGYTVRVNWEMPTSFQKRYKFFKRDVHNDIENIPNETAVEAFSCVFKHFCSILERMISSESCGFFCEIGSIISREEGLESTFFKNFWTKCDYYDAACPYTAEDLANFSYG